MRTASRQAHDTYVRPYRMPPRIYAPPGALVFAMIRSRGLLHGAIAPAIEGRTQPYVGRTLCGKRSALTPERYRDLWPDTRFSCSSCWRIAMRRGLARAA